MTIESEEELTLAAKPPMGWNSWLQFSHQMDAQTVREIADAMVESGMRDAGYEYVNIDDTWQALKRDDDGKLEPNPMKFPDGIEPLADYVHDRGLKLGFYSNAGIKTCQGFPGSLMHERQDAETFAEWGVDFLKYDNCYNLWSKRDELLAGEDLDWHYPGSYRKYTWEDIADGPAFYREFDQTKYADAIDLLAEHSNEKEWAKTRFRRMGEALNSVDRDIVYSICCWGKYDIEEWARDVGGHMWRTTGDISPRWDDVMRKFDRQVGLAEYAGPGGWNDPEVVPVGHQYEIRNGARFADENLTLRECHSVFSLWAMLAAPILAGNDIRHMPDEIADILTKESVIAIDQDPAGNQATKEVDNGDTEAWARELANGDVAVALLNRSDRATRIGVHSSTVGLEEPTDGSAYVVRDLWTDDRMSTAGVIASRIPAHGVTLYRVRSESGIAAPPLVTIDGKIDSSATSGTETTIPLTVENHGKTEAAAVTVAAIGPESWVESSDVAVTGSLPGGERADVTLTVAPPATVEDGSHEIEIELWYGSPSTATYDTSDPEPVTRSTTVDVHVT